MYIFYNSLMRYKYARYPELAARMRLKTDKASRGALHTAADVTIVLVLTISVMFESNPLLTSIGLRYF